MKLYREVTHIETNSIDEIKAMFKLVEPIEITEDRPVLKNFFSEDASLNDVHETYINAKPLFQYAQALEEYIDSLLSKLQNG